MTERAAQLIEQAINEARINDIIDNDTGEIYADSLDDRTLDAAIRRFNLKVVGRKTSGGRNEIYIDSTGLSRRDADALFSLNPAREQRVRRKLNAYGDVSSFVRFDPNDRRSMLVVPRGHRIRLPR